jgi:hypothetical protein
MPDMVNPVSCEYDAVQLPIQDEDICDNDSADNNNNVPALIERHLVDSDSDSSMEYRCLARRHGWHEDLLDSSDDLSTPSSGDGSKDGSEGDTSDCIPIG